MHLLTFWLYRAIGGAIALLPLSAGIRLGRLLGWLGFLLAGKYRRLATHNLGIAFPDLSARERRALARRHFTTLGGNLFAMERISRLSRERIRALVDVEGIAHVEQLTAEKRGFVFIVSHIGNWELLAQVSPIVFPVPAGTVFQRLSNPHMDVHVRRTRARIGLALFERKDGFSAACELLRKGGTVGVLVDQHAGDAGVWTPLFGRLASTSPLAATMALRTGAALLPVAMHTHGIGRWRMVIGEPFDLPGRDPAEGTRQINLLLEAQIRHAPADWFWVHNRWKTPRPKFLLATYKRGIALAPDGKLQPFRIVIRSSNWLGDAVMTVPAVRAIKRGRPDAHITILTPAKLADVWRLLPEVDDVIPFERMAPWKVARLLRGRGFDVAVIFPNSIRTAFEMWFAGIPRRVGRPGHKGRALLLDQIFREKTKRAPAHQVHDYLALAEFIGADIAETPFAIPRPAPKGTVARIAVCPGAEYGPAKRWLPERFTEVIRTLDAERACQWFLVGTAKDRPIAEQIAVTPTVENKCGETTLAELIALLRTCHVLLTNDTGTMHLAALLGVRTVSIFGSTEPSLTGPLGDGHTVLRVKPDCSPCFLRECPIDFRCMTAITAADAADALRATLAGISK